MRTICAQSMAASGSAHAPSPGDHRSWASLALGLGHGDQQAPAGWVVQQAGVPPPSLQPQACLLLSPLSWLQHQGRGYCGPR